MRKFWFTKVGRQCIWKQHTNAYHLYNTRRALQFSSQSSLCPRQQIKSHQLSMSYHQHNIHSLSAIDLSSSVLTSVNLCVTVIYMYFSFVLFIVPCPRRALLFRLPWQYRCRCYRCKPQFSQSHSQQQDKCMVNQITLAAKVQRTTHWARRPDR